MNQSEVNLLGILKDNGLQSENEKEYVGDIIIAGRIFNGERIEGLPDIYKICIWAVHNSESE